MEKKGIRNEKTERALGITSPWGCSNPDCKTLWGKETPASSGRTSSSRIAPRASEGEARMGAKGALEWLPVHVSDQV